ncbi:MAG: putative mannosyl-3-phosphoglycerate phosphatase [Inoviridae sp.]|nr:MAG: putative mannosyl-3-phosphoglycerate phosphatase [Inoviridae sp.]
MAGKYYFGQSGTEITRSQLRVFRRDYRNYRKSLRRRSNFGHYSWASDSVPNYSSIPLTVFVILFLLSFSSALMGRDSSISFSGLLNAISSAPTIDMSVIFDFVTDWRITGNWVAFNWFRDFLNDLFLPFIGVVVYFCASIAQLLLLLIWVARFLLTGVY